MAYGVLASRIRKALRSAFLQWALVFVAVSLVWLPFFRSPRVDNSLLDWSYRADYIAYELNALRRDHAFPYWVTDERFEQYRAKGVHDFFANPETDLFSLVTPVAAVSNVLTAVKVALLVYLALGVWGFRRSLIALTGEARLVPFLIGSLLAFDNGAFVAHVVAGHVQFAVVASFPLSLAFLLEAFDATLSARQRALRACLSGGLLAVAYYAGAAHLLFYCLPVLLLFLPAFTVLTAPRRFRAVLLATTLAGVSFVLISAFKLLPGLHDFSGYSCEYRDVFDTFRDFTTELVIPWNPEGNDTHHETNIYVGWLGAVLFALCLPAIRDRRCRPLLLAGVLLGSVMFFKDPRLFALPFLRSQGALRRARIVVAFVAALLATTQLQHLEVWVRRLPLRRARVSATAAALALTLFLAVDLSQTNVRRHEDLRSQFDLPVSGGPFDVAPELVAPPDVHAHAVSRGVEANWFAYDVTTSSQKPVIVRFPQLSAWPRPPHLRLVGDGELVVDDGAMAVRFPGPHARFELRFSDPLTTWGLSLSLLGLCALVGLGIAARAPRIPRAV